MYLIFSVSMQGWLTKTATYSSDPDDAKRFARGDAIAACKDHMHAQARGYDWLPVYLNDLEAIRTWK
jgi:hypothetical protein